MITTIKQVKIKLSLDNLRILPPIPEHGRKSNIKSSNLLLKDEEYDIQKQLEILD
jgi:hypothetical protein